MTTNLLSLSVLVLALGGLAWRVFRRRNLDRWLPSYWLTAPKRRPVQPGEPVHLILCIADHFEPKLGNASPAVARRRVDRWVRNYPRYLGGFRDSDRRRPRHTFFYPIEEYEAEHLDALAELCRSGYGEVEVHLHHDNDTADGLRSKLVHFKEVLAGQHGLLARRRDTDELVYGFIHGNWALDNSRPDGCWCGVNNELEVLRTTGCYADFTLPSVPSPAQTRTINSIYYAWGRPNRSKSHDTGIAVGTIPPPNDALMLIQGPLMLNWKSRKWGIVPHIENACLQGTQPPSMARLDLWLRARIQVPSRPDWFFVKLHTHGANEANQKALLGKPMAAFHRALAERAAADPNFHYHYVTAREMYNLVRAAEAGWQHSVASALDYELLWNGCGSLSLSPV